MVTCSKVFGIEVSSVAACAQISALADGAVSVAVEFIARSLGEKPTLEAYNALRVEWRGAYMVQRGLDAVDKLTANALDVAWSRNVLDGLKAEFGFSIPKATSAEAVKKAEARKVPEVVAAAQSVAHLDAIALPSDAVEAAKLQKAISDKKLALVRAEAKQAEKTRAEALKARGDTLTAYVRECVKSGRADLLAELESMRDHYVPAVLAALPLAAIQESMPKLIELAASAPKKAQKPRKTKKEDALM